MNYPQDRIFIALGSSIGDAKSIFESAESYLKEDGVKVLKKSKNYEFPPHGGVAKNNFTNAVWEIEIEGLVAFTYDRARKLLNLLHECELAHGRTRVEKWGDRTLDLDILIFGDLRCLTQKLQIPHLEMEQREFVMTPLRAVLGLTDGGE